MSYVLVFTKHEHRLIERHLSEDDVLRSIANTAPGFTVEVYEAKLISRLEVK